MRRAQLPVLLLLLAGAAACVERTEHAEPETFLMPIGFVGDVYVIFNVSDGAAPEMRDGRRIYRVPPSGILRTQFPPAYGRASWSFVYAGASDGAPVRIPRGPGGTLHDTPQNRAETAVEINGLQIGTSRARMPEQSGTSSSHAQCSVKFYQFFVGTRAQYFDQARTLDLDKYLELHPVPCSPTT